MAQKINPISLRLEKTNRSMDSSWFNQSHYVNLLMKDFKIQWYIDLILKKIQFCSARYSITHLPTKIKINIFFCNPNKNRKYISKIFYLNYRKKIKTIQKNFFNKSHVGFSVKQSKVFKYIMKSLNDDACESFRSKKHTNLLRNPSKIQNDNKNKNNINIFFENYFPLYDFIKSYNQFYMRYFLIKYFSIKFPVCLNLQKTINSSNQKNHSASVFSTLRKLNEKNQVFIDFNKTIYCSFNSLKKAHQNILFKHILGFLFLQIYKNKNFLALKYLNRKINNYKKISQNSNAIYEKLKKHKLKQAFYTINFEKKNNSTYLNSHLISQNIALQHKKPVFFFLTSFLQLKLKILSFLKKNTLNYAQQTQFDVKKNTEVNFISSINSKKKFVPTFNDVTSLIKLHTCCKQFTFYDRKNNLINWNSKKSYVFFNEQKNKYYDLSLMNTKCINDTYNQYCKLFQFSKRYAINNTRTSNKLVLAEKKKVILPSSPYKFHMEAILCNQFSRNINFRFFQTSNIFQNAFFLIDEVIYYIEKRVPFFKIKNYILKKLAEQKLNCIKGIRVTCSGRIGGKSKKAQRSKVQSFKYGETSLHVFSSKIDFKSKNAFTSFGTLGIKIWICYH